MVAYSLDEAFLRKLGIKTGERVALVDAPEVFSGLFRHLLPADSFPLDAWDSAHYDIALVWMQDTWDLEAAFPTLQRMIQPDGAVWAVIPKKRYQGRGYPDVSFGQVQMAGLSTDLVDNKELGFSPQEYAIRFVVRKERRASLPPVSAEDPYGKTDRG